MAEGGSSSERIHKLSLKQQPRKKRHRPIGAKLNVGIVGNHRRSSEAEVSSRES